MDELLVAIQGAANTIAAPNWADKLSVLLSLLAIFAASIVAWRQNKISREQTEISKKQTEISQEQVSIADKQNRIALFEKRLEIYEILLACSANIESIKSLGENEDILRRLLIILSDNPEEYLEYNRDKAKLYLANCSIKLRRAIFFFPEKIVPYIDNVSMALIRLARVDVKTDEPKKYNERKQDFFESINALKENEILKTIIEEMKMMI